MRILIIIISILIAFPVIAQRDKQLGADNLNYYFPRLKITSLATGGTAPTTSGTTKMVITDANGQLSFADIPSTSGFATVLKGTVNWTPGIVAAGSSASTTVNVTGAVVGDPVTVSKKAGYSNGEIYDAAVTAPGVVTIRVHNVSTGSANYNTAADYNVVLLKY
jgi:hypothetical protein